MGKGIWGLAGFAALPIVRLVANNLGEPLPVGRFALYWLALVGSLAALLMGVHRVRPEITARLSAALALSVLAVVYLSVALRGWLGLGDILGVDGALWLAAALVSGSILGSRWTLVQGAVPMLSLLLLLYPSFQIASGWGDVTVTSGYSTAMDLTRNETPSVYWFVLDGYGRLETLEDFGSNDQRDFLAELEARGFAVDNHASAAYPMSFLSIASTLSMDYIADETNDVESGRHYYAIIQGANTVVDTFRSWGYQYALYPSTLWEGSQCRGYEDICLRELPLDPADWALVSMTVLESILGGSVERDLATQISPVNVVDMLELHSPRRPLFVFAHLINPHPPHYRIGPNCDTQGSASQLRGDWGTESEYLQAVRCLNKDLLLAVDRIIETEPGAIILLQGDHGPAHGVDGLIAPSESWTDEDLLVRLSVLSAMRLPEHCSGSDASSLVNTFRIVFSCTSGENVGSLTARAWAGAYDSRYLMEVTPPD